MKMRYFLLAVLPFAFLCGSCTKGTDVRAVAEKVIDRGPEYLDYGHYTGTVFTQSLAEFVGQTGSRKYRKMAEGIVDSFADGSLKGYGSFISYHTGGPIVPQMALMGYAPAEDLAKQTAARMWVEQPRNLDGVMLPPWKGIREKNGIFVDCVLAVPTYLLYSGLLEGNREDYLDYAAWMAIKTYEDLYDPASGLVNQARAVNWLEEGQRTSDCWSRGNGWLSMGLAALLKDLPRENRYRADLERVCRDFYTAVLRWQGEDGVWHQEMTFPDSYAEMSGTGLLLYGLGRAIEAGVIDRETGLPAFKRGLAGMLRYVDMAGNVGNTCSGCLAWGDGSKEAYAGHDYFCNEVHSFGPVVFALTEALALGIRRVDAELGEALEGKVPACHVRQVSERKNDVAWENDMAAFRIYSQEVKKKVSSGVDYWAKRVDYPIVEQWYSLNDKGLDYHHDRGQGCDFYGVGRNRGIGGVGVWTGEELLVPEPYVECRILQDSPSKAAFELVYPPIEKDGAKYELSEKVEMVLRTPFYRKSIILRHTGSDKVMVAVGLTDFGAAEAVENDAACTLSLLEAIGEESQANSPEPELIAGAVVADPLRFAGFASYGKDRLLLMEPNDDDAPSVCFVGVAWNRDLRWRSLRKKWPKTLADNTFEALSEQYGK